MAGAHPGDGARNRLRRAAPPQDVSLNFVCYEANVSQHPKRLHIGLEDGLLFGALVGILLAHPDDGAQRLGVVAVALGFRVDVA